MEDIANANSTACLAAYLAAGGRHEITVEMGDAVGSPSTITVTVSPRGLASAGSGSGGSARSG
jgi:trans-2,3-dihydro-3-hydroxyanthranilate isomerase